MQMVMVALEANQPHPSAQCCESARPAFTVELYLSTSSSIRSFRSELNSLSVLRSLWAALCQAMLCLRQKFSKFSIPSSSVRTKHYFHP